MIQSKCLVYIAPTKTMMLMGILSDKTKKRTASVSLEWELKKRNEELEEEVRRSKEREDHLRQQLRQALDRLTVAEDAEERLCVQLGDLEAEAVQQARQYHAHILQLLHQLSQSHPSLGFQTHSG